MNILGYILTAIGWFAIGYISRVIYSERERDLTSPNERSERE